MMMARKTLLTVCALALTIGGAVGCRDRSAPTPESQPSDSEELDPINPRGVAPPEIIFPAALRTDDASLNQFIDDVLASCVKGEYGRYRLAVASQYEPLPKQNFERAWRAVKEVRVRKIMLVHTPTTRQTDPSRTNVPPELKTPIYCAHATIALRDDRRARPVREVVVLVIQENGEWKLGPPAPLALKHRIMGTRAEANDMVTPITEEELPPSSQPATTTSAP